MAVCTAAEVIELSPMYCGNELFDGDTDWCRVLRSMMQVAEAAVRTKFLGVVVTVPDSFGQSKVEAIEAAALSCMNLMDVIKEPIAAIYA